MNARQFAKELSATRTEADLENVRKHYKGPSDSRLLGVRMGTIFKLAKGYTSLPIDEIEKLLDSDFYEIRMGAVSVMDFQARSRRTTVDQRQALFNLYIDRHDRINNWDLVDRGAPWVVGGYLFERSRKPLYRLARSKDHWERRTSIVATWYFIRQDDLDDTFSIAQRLLSDKSEFVQKPVGSWLREAGKRDEERLCGFLDQFAAAMSPVTLRYATEKLNSRLRDRYLAGRLKKAARKKK